MEQFDAVAVFVDEDVDISVARIAVKDVGHYAAERMKTLAHIGRLILLQIPHTVVKAKHGRLLQGLLTGVAWDSCRPGFASLSH